MAFMTIKQTAKELNLPEHFVRRRVKTGEWPGFKSGTRIYIDTDAFAASLSKVQPAATNNEKE